MDSLHNSSLVPFHTASDKSLGRPRYEANITVHVQWVLKWTTHLIKSSLQFDTVIVPLVMVPWGNDASPSI